MKGNAMETFTLPSSFKLGTATAALQTEGGDRNNNWYEWCELGKIKDGSHSLRANDHYQRVEEDIGLLKELKSSCYRMGVEWSRLEPEEGKFSRDAVNHYRHELQLLKDSGIEPVITLFHFSYPLWFARYGAFESMSGVERFKRFTAFCIEAFGDLCREWIPVNEPNVFAFNGYMDGSWPPGEKDMGLALRVMRHLAVCHMEAYKLIHAIRKAKGWEGETRVGLAVHLRVFDPLSRSPLDRLAANFVQWMFQGAVTHAMTTGRLTWPLGHGTPCGTGIFSDFTGINYYTRDRVKASFRGGYRLSTEKDAPKNDLGWEIYPQGLYRLCKACYEKYRLPIYITENGTCDAKDAFRPQFICYHLAQVSRLIEEGIPVERYYHWTLMDNFEWVEGESAPFGLIHCDFETQKRTLRKSGRLYAEISEKKALTVDMIKRFL